MSVDRGAQLGGWYCRILMFFRQQTSINIKSILVNKFKFVWNVDLEFDFRQIINDILITGQSFFNNVPSELTYLSSEKQICIKN
jgi:hypothetical protein